MTTTSKPIDYQHIMELHRQGQSQNSIVAQTGLTKPVVNTVIRTLEHLGGQDQDISDSVRIIPFDQVRPNPWQMRKSMDPERLQRLATSIAEIGLRQLPEGRETFLNGVADGVQLAFGHRRLAAVKLLVESGQWGFDGMPVKVVDLSDSQMVLVGWAENAERDDLDPLDELQGIAHALETVEGLTVTQLAAQKGIHYSTLSNWLRCLKLPPVVLALVSSREMTLSGAREFLCLQNEDHCHADMMAWVISKIQITMGLPDFRPKHVRQAISSLTSMKADEWRPLEPAPSHKVGVPGNQGRSPSFEAQPFMQMHPHLVHRLPDSNNDGTHAWTCDVKLWQREQTAATLKANQEAAEQGAAPSSGQQAKESPDQRWIAALKQDPTVVALLGQPTPTIVQLGKMLEIPETAEMLGSLAQRVTNSDRSLEYLEGAPTFMASKEECYQTCTWGAKLHVRPAWQGGVERVCTNQACYQRKCEAGRGSFEVELQQARVRHQQKADKLIPALAARLSDGMARRILDLARLTARGDALLMRTTQTRDHDIDAQSAYFPDYLQGWLDTLGVEVLGLTHSYETARVTWDKIIEKLTTEHDLPDLAATMWVYLTNWDMEEENHA